MDITESLEQMALSMPSGTVDRLAPGRVWAIDFPEGVSSIVVQADRRYFRFGYGATFSDRATRLAMARCGKSHTGAQRQSRLLHLIGNTMRYTGS